MAKTLMNLSIDSDIAKIIRLKYHGAASRMVEGYFRTIINTEYGTLEHEGQPVSASKKLELLKTQIAESKALDAARRAEVQSLEEELARIKKLGEQKSLLQKEEKARILMKAMANKR